MVLQQMTESNGLAGACSPFGLPGLGKTTALEQPWLLGTSAILHPSTASPTTPHQHSSCPIARLEHSRRRLCSHGVKRRWGEAGKCASTQEMEGTGQHCTDPQLGQKAPHMVTFTFGVGTTGDILLRTQDRELQCCSISPRHTRAGFGLGFEANWPSSLFAFLLAECHFLQKMLFCNYCELHMKSERPHIDWSPGKAPEPFRLD